MKSPHCFRRLAFQFSFAFLVAVAPLALQAEITPGEIRKTEAKVQKLARETLPATVSLIPGGMAPRMGTGSGVIVDESGLILTAAHVAMEMNEVVTVIFPNGDRATAKVLGMDFARDAAMLQITDEGKYPFVEVGDSDSKIDNDWCIALGHASGFQPDRTPPIRLGRVIQNDPKAFLRSDCALIAGDSGGPLFDIDGKLIGIHSNIGMTLSENNHVPISTFVKNWDRLKKGERFGNNGPGGLQNPERATLGARLGDASDESGALVRRVLPGSPAEKAGLKKGDIIVGAGDREVLDRGGLAEMISRRKVGDRLTLSVKSEDAEEVREVEIKLGSVLDLRRGPRTRPEDPPPAEPKEKPEAGKPSEPAPEPESRPKEKTDSVPDADKPKEEKSESGKTSAAEKAEPKKTKAEIEAEQKKFQAEFSRKLRESLETDEWKLDREDFEKWENPADFMEFIEKFRKSLTPEEAEKFADMIRPGREKPIRPESFDPDAPIPAGEGFYRDVLNAFRPSVAGASDATHLVFRGRDWKSLCTIVDEAGYALTKASDVKTENNQALTVMLAKDRLVPAEVVKTFPDYDLALLKLEKPGPLTPVVWSTSKMDLPLGSFIAAAGSGPDALAIGLISVQSRSLTGRNKGFLGISAAPHEKGVRVAQVVPGSSAGEAGVKRDDVITKIGDEVCDTPEKLIRLVSGTRPGETITLHYLREGKADTRDVTLGDRGELDAHRGDPTGMMNRMGTELSERRSDYPKVLQSDLPIRPEECGGPVVDLDGKAIGINIARAGRIKTYALPAADVLKLIKPELDRVREKPEPEKKKPAKKKESASKAD